MQGLSRTFQHIRLFAHMTALENVMVGRHVRSRAGFLAGMLNLPWTWREEREIHDRALALMEFLGIAGLADADATSLSYGQQRAVELARALAGDPAMLLLDEPAAGLNMRETADTARLISRIRDLGVTVLIVEHDMSLVMNISDEVLVLSATAKRSPTMRRARSRATPKWSGSIWGRTMLRIRNLDAGYGNLNVLRRVSIHVKPGEIVTIIGANGAGKTTLLKTITGLLRARSGRDPLRWTGHQQRAHGADRFWRLLARARGPAGVPCHAGEGEPAARRLCAVQARQQARSGT